MLYNSSWDKHQQAIDLSKPSLPALIYVLRHKETWPPRFVWNYGHIHSCVMGLAHKLWPEYVMWPLPHVMLEVFGIPLDVSRKVFCRMFFIRTPKRVANKLERCMAKVSDI